jgi:hypothetical protein
MLVLLPSVVNSKLADKVTVLLAQMSPYHSFVRLQNRDPAGH